MEDIYPCENIELIMYLVQTILALLPFYSVLSIDTCYCHCVDSMETFSVKMSLLLFVPQNSFLFLLTS